ncbi:aminotransferase class V-fold PLP-dependent enzyme [Cohaesibacter gelatinilyticus]|uniref:L-seryl-tRNA(Ser) seleniumtransferase/D-glucosaminate-6-phosphate ammonia-lyase n=1 Tax=Cohaesibacter gelatinilyticus TaxID=372072 RepID=A0A285NC62_9HYPH|nr:beta-eliminating lyase-related protein [Cohaesibacter gelatinilyticus]SNZ06527.1 L-seryl-tRNA(Ser) seleniumtransferase/D-glucosaminate-6-phosphate ammonia-lyase [Cohaesibacter gelatinilyticus]
MSHSPASSGLINARGTFTPLGVSRSSAAIAHATANALSEFHKISDLQITLESALQKWSGAEAGFATHCTAASITLAVAACLTSTDQEAIASLPHYDGAHRKVLIPAGHCVNYGQSILQAIRLSGAKPYIVGSEHSYSLQDLEEALKADGIAALLLVSSRLTKGDAIDFNAAVALAHSYSVPVILDAAAQDFRVRELVETDADLILISAQKYMAAPTTGLIVGKASHIAAVKAQEAGIGRAMKASKEALMGALAALEERLSLDLSAWKAEQSEKAHHFVTSANEIKGITAWAEPDSTGLPFDRPCLKVDSDLYGCSATELADRLRNSSPYIWVIDHLAEQSLLLFELVPLKQEECKAILDRLAVSQRD